MSAPSGRATVSDRFYSQIRLESRARLEGGAQARGRTQGTMEVSMTQQSLLRIIDSELAAMGAQSIEAKLAETLAVPSDHVSVMEVGALSHLLLFS